MSCHVYVVGSIASRCLGHFKSSIWCSHALVIAGERPIHLKIEASCQLIQGIFLVCSLVRGLGNCQRAKTCFNSVCMSSFHIKGIIDPLS